MLTMHAKLQDAFGNYTTMASSSLKLLWKGGKIFYCTYLDIRKGFLLSKMTTNN